MRSNCILLFNDPIRIDRTREKYETIASVGEIQLRQHQVKIVMAEKEKEDLHPLLGSAVKLYRSDDHGRLLTEPKICSILHLFVGIIPDIIGGKKEEWLQQLKTITTLDTLNYIDLTLLAFTVTLLSPVIKPIVPAVDPNDGLVTVLADIVPQEDSQSTKSTATLNNEIT